MASKGWGVQLKSSRLSASWGLLLMAAVFISFEFTSLAGTATTTTLVSDNNPSVYGEDVTFTATVSPIPDGGTVTFKDGTTALATVNVNANGVASYSTDSLSVGTHSITAAYSGTANYDPSTSDTVNQVVQRATKVTVFCSDTPLVVGDTATCTVTVEGLPSNASVPPTGEVTLSSSGNGTLSPTSYTLQEADGGQFQFTYTPQDADGSPHVITATYDGDSNYSPASETFDQEVIKRAADIKLVLDPTTAYIGQEVTVTVTVTDDTTAGTASTPEGTVTFDDGGRNGVFSSDTATLSDGTCSVTYTPGAWDAGTTTITAAYEGSSVHAAAAATELLTVELRPTEISVDGPSQALIVYQKGDFTIEVKDAAGVGAASAPLGNVNVTPSLSPTGDSVIYNKSGPFPDDSVSTWTFDYYRKSLSNDGDYDTFRIEYTADDGVHADTEIGYAQAIIRRPTVTTLSGCSCNADGVSCTVTVEDDPGNPAPPVTVPGPAGDFYAWVDTDGDGVLEEVDVGDADSATVQIDSNLIVTNVTVQYRPSDNIYQKSTVSENVDRSSCMPSPSPTPGDATSCTAGCGEGGVNVYAIIDGLNAGCLAASSLALVLDAAMLAIDPTPDPVVGAGFLVITGSTIPTSDIAAAIIGGVKIGLETYSLIACTDSDSDGIQDVVELGTTGTDPYSRDTDGDAMSDGDEIGYCSGYYGGSRRPDPNNPDSDGDGLLDGYELAPYSTDVCVADSDCDTVPDGVEIACRVAPTAANGFDEATFSSLGYSFAFPFSDPRDWPNPREGDTDGDGLPDSVELGPGKLATSINDTTYSPYVNDADSDGDGILDGDESTNGDEIWDYTQIGSTGTTGSGETHLCMADTDGDGLTDGEEEALFGRGPIEVHSTLGTITTPALDDDSDDDGLSDYEEQVVTHTDPLNWDTDGDGLSDLNELIATGGTYPQRSFRQVSDPLDPDTDDDGLLDSIEYNGTGLGTSHGLGGSEDTSCPYVNDADSDDDGLQDGVEDANHDGTWGVNGSGCTIGSFDTQAAPASDGYYETDLCNPDTDGDGILDGEEASQLGGGPVIGRPAAWPDAQPTPGFNTVTPEGRSTVLPTADYSGTGPLYTFTPTPGPAIAPTVPALDVDSDNDGLSDYEEVNTTGTDPLDADSDDDTIMDADELIATGGTPGDHPQRTFEQESDPLDINTDDDYLPDPVEGSCGDPVYTGTGLSALGGALGGTRDTDCPYVNNADSDDDGVQDGAVITITKQGPNGFTYSYVFIEGFQDVAPADVQGPGTVRIVVTPATGEQNDDQICNVCDSDSDGDGLTDGEEVGLGTDPQDWDTDDDGRSDWHEVTGGGPVPTDPFDPDTDDDGLLDSAEVFGSNPTNPVVADTDGDGLCDGGAGTPYMTSGHPTVTVNPICKSCAIPGNAPCAGPRSGSASGIGDHPNPMGLGEDENGNGAWDAGETDPNQYDTDGDAEGDGIEVLGFSTSRQSMIPAQDLFGRPINVVYPSCGCLDPLNPDTDGDGLSDGYEDRNHDGNFDFLPSEFDHADPLPGPPIPYPTETNPCDPDTDHDGLTDYQERYQPNPAAAYPFNPTNPLDHDTDNDWLLDGEEVDYVCTELVFDNLDNDGDGLVDEDPPDELDNDGDGLIDEDGPDFYVRSVPMLDPTNRDSDSDGFIDGLDPDPCNSSLIPIVSPPGNIPVDTDEDGYADQDEALAGTDPLDPDSHPYGYTADLDLDGVEDDRLWLVATGQDCFAELVVIDLDSNGLVDFWLRILPRDVVKDDFDGDGVAADARYRVAFALAGRRALQPRILLTVFDYGCDLGVDRVEVRKD